MQHVLYNPRYNSWTPFGAVFWVFFCSLAQHMGTQKKTGKTFRLRNAAAKKFIQPTFS